MSSDLTKAFLDTGFSEFNPVLITSELQEALTGRIILFGGKSFFITEKDSTGTIDKVSALPSSNKYIYELAEDTTVLTITNILIIITQAGNEKVRITNPCIVSRIKAELGIQEYILDSVISQSPNLETPVLTPVANAKTSQRYELSKTIEITNLQSKLRLNPNVNFCRLSSGNVTDLIDLDNSTWTNQGYLDYLNPSYTQTTDRFIWFQLTYSQWRAVNVIEYINLDR